MSQTPLQRGASLDVAALLGDDSEPFEERDIPTPQYLPLASAEDS